MVFTGSGKVKTDYQVLGKGKPFVLLHGWANTGNAWGYLIPQLSRHFMLYIPDLPGFGKSSTPSQEFWTTEDYANWLSEFASYCTKGTPFCIAGHSFGGQILMEYCSSGRKPQPDKLILIGTAGLKRERTMKNIVFGEMAKLLPDTWKKRLPKRIKQVVYEKILTETDYFRGDAFQKNVLKHILRDDYTGYLSDIRVPTLIIHGEKDLSVPYKNAVTMSERIPNSTLLTCEDSGHFPHIDETPKVSRAIERFCVE